MVGSMSRIEEYQRVLSGLKSEGGSIVTGEMIDRLLDQGGVLVQIRGLRHSHCTPSTTSHSPRSASTAHTGKAAKPRPSIDSAFRPSPGRNPVVGDDAASRFLGGPLVHTSSPDSIDECCRLHVPASPSSAKHEDATAGKTPGLAATFDKQSAESRNLVT